jgi:GT2 family glycosyltransferase
MNKIDVVVPVYNAYTCVKDCLNSLAEHQQPVDNIYLIDDCSSDVRIKPLLQKFAKENNWKVYSQDKNKGFVKTANKGLRLSKNNTVLLNSDTIVSKNWLLGFRECIENNIDLATATAWSNNAEICSFPKFLKNNALPDNINKFSQNLYENYRPVYPEIPTAVGFCMLITKQAKQIVGYLDEKQFGHGYGEENDYSLRASNKNLRNVVCDNIYVAHVGNQSFSDLGIKADENSMKRLLAKHPNYLELIHDFISQDPLAEVRKIILAKIKKV